MAEVTGRLQEASVEAVVLRCGCGAPAEHPDEVCPRAWAEPLGVVSYWHSNPLRRWLWAARHRWVRGK